MTDQDQSPAADIKRWFIDHLPDGWFDDEPRILVDRDEILVLGTVAGTADDDAGGDADTGDEVRITSFRESTRDHRIRIAEHAEALFARKVTWGARSGDTRVLFTHLTVPVMTRLRIDERHILDTLVAAGVARSRSDALGWCVRLVAEHEGDWLEELRDALTAVERVRAKGPG